MMSLKQGRSGDDRILVPARRLSSFITQRVELLKMDIEGAEDSVLQELAASGKLELIQQIHLEYHHHIQQHSDRLSGTLRLLEDQGFGYQLRAHPRRWPISQAFQDISLYCYRKS
jgi:hypothetical protein